MNKQEEIIIDNVIQSIRNKPYEWILTHYRMEHESGVSIWIANGISFLHIEADNLSVPNDGFNPFGIFVPWRRRLWKEIKNFENNKEIYIKEFGDFTVKTIDISK